MAFQDKTLEHVPKIPYFYIGSVIQNDDPERLGRIRALVPGVKGTGEGTGWAYPVGFPGCGPSRGYISIPPVESNVLIGFVQGDPDQPFYLCGPWGAAQGSSEVPREAAKQEPQDVVKVHGLESEEFEIFINDKDRKLVIRTKNLDQEIEMDMTDRSIKLKTTNWCIIEAGAVNIEAGKIQLGGRIVLPIGGPI